MKTKQVGEHRAGKIWPIIKIAARKVQEDPTILDDEQRFKAFLVSSIPELKDKMHCANCGESMAIYTYSVSYADARLLCAMANCITKKTKNGMTFTEANKTHLPSEVNDYTLVSRQTIASKLGLIAKVLKGGGDKTHDRKKGWSITTRGFDFLRGEPVPKSVKVFRSHIEERFEEKTTFREVMQGSTKPGEFRILSDSIGVFIEEYQKPRLLGV